MNAEYAWICAVILTACTALCGCGGAQTVAPPPVAEEGYLDPWGTPVAYSQTPAPSSGSGAPATAAETDEAKPKTDEESTPAAPAAEEEATTARNLGDDGDDE